MKLRTALELAALAALLQARPTHADTDLRCGLNLVRLGDTAATVEDRCGAPTSKRHLETTLRGRAGSVRLEGELWTYDRGPYQLSRILVLERDKSGLGACHAPAAALIWARLLA